MNDRKNKVKPFNVYLDGKLLYTAWFAHQMTLRQAKRSLVERGGYSARITLKE